MDEDQAIKVCRNIVVQVVANLHDLQMSVGTNFMVDDMRAKSSQVSFALGRILELFTVLL